MIEFADTVRQPPGIVVAQISARAPGFWRDFGESADRALDGIDGTVTSWFRSLADNLRVGGVVESQHRWGCAMDLVVADPGQRALAVQRLKAEGFFVVVEATHVHFQAFPAGTLGASGIAPG